MLNSIKFKGLYGIEYEVYEMHGEYEATLSKQTAKNVNFNQRYLEAVTVLVKSIAGHTGEITEATIKKLPEIDIHQIVTKARELVPKIDMETGEMVDDEPATINIKHPDKEGVFYTVKLEDCKKESQPQKYDPVTKKWSPLVFSTLKEFTEANSLKEDKGTDFRFYFPANKTTYSFRAFTMGDSVKFSKQVELDTLKLLSARNLKAKKDGEERFVKLLDTDIRKLSNAELKFIKGRIDKMEGDFKLEYLAEDTGQVINIMAEPDFLLLTVS